MIRNIQISFFQLMHTGCVHNKHRLKWVKINVRCAIRAAFMSHDHFTFPMCYISLTAYRAQASIL